MVNKVLKFSKILFVVFIISLQNEIIKAQEIGTIEVSMDFAATIKFPVDISKPVFGFNPVLKIVPLNDGSNLTIYKNFNYEIAGQNLIIRASNINPQETTITIILVDNTVYTGKIKYSDNPLKSYYEFGFVQGQKNSENEVYNNEKKDEAKIVDKVFLEKRLTEVINDKLAKQLDVSYNSNVYFIISNIRNDEDHTYIKITIANNSSSEYEIDGVIFKHVEMMKKKMNKSEVGNTEPIMPLISKYPDKMAIKAQSNGILGFVLPLYTTGENGNLVIQFVEKNGSRNTEIQLTAKELSKVKIF